MIIKLIYLARNELIIIRLNPCSLSRRIGLLVRGRQKRNPLEDAGILKRV